MRPDDYLMVKVYVQIDQSPLAEPMTMSAVYDPSCALEWPPGLIGLLVHPCYTRL